MKLAHLDDVHVLFCFMFVCFFWGGDWFFCFFSHKKFITNKTSNIFYLIAEYSDFIEYNLIKLN